MCVVVLPLVVSSSMGCLKTVMSLKVQRNRTTLSFSFLIGATCMYSHTGLPDLAEERKYENKKIGMRYEWLYKNRDENKRSRNEKRSFGGYNGFMG